MIHRKKLAAASAVAGVFCVAAVVAVYLMWPGDGRSIQIPAPIAANAQPAAAPPATGPVLLGPAATPTGTLKGAYNAALAGDSAALIASFDQLTPAEEVELRQIARVFAAGAEFHAAVAKRFGDAAADSLVHATGLDLGVRASDISRATAMIDGDTAVIHMRPTGQLNLVRVGGLWRISSRNLPRADQVARMNDYLPTFHHLSDQVTAGAYLTAADLRQNVSGMRNQILSGPVLSQPPTRPSVLGPGRTPRETIQSLYWATVTGDENAVIACFNNLTTAQQARVRLSTQLFAAGADLEAAITRRFGQSPAMSMALQLGLELGVTEPGLESATETDSGDLATVDLIQTGLGLVTLERVNGVWKISGNYVWVENPVWAARLADYYLPAIRQLASDVSAGKYQAVGDLKLAVGKLADQMKAEHKQYQLATTR